MPEGDTLHRTALTLGRALTGRRIVTARCPTGAVNAAEIAGRCVLGVEARGKNLLLRLDDGSALHSHLRMTGSWHVYARGERWRKSPRGARLVLETDTHVVVCFHAPVLALLGRCADVPLSLASLGPDVLAPDFDVDLAVRRLRGAARLPLGVALLTQSLVAGIGNVYKSEALFLAGLDPFAPVAAFDDASLRRVLLVARSEMQVNLRGYPRDTRRDGSGVRTWVYGRRGEPCARCGRPVEMRRQGDGARSTYFCAGCQRPPHSDGCVGIAPSAARLRGHGNPVTARASPCEGTECRRGAANDRARDGCGVRPHAPRKP
jgi:endonuclease-8